ncbi:Potassium voltage-gated channel subfamily S member 1 [Tupaia chinensis]|uniref:Potassium voltage-gated channel subfamily S member 1 n=1 Tax=Tupaia chinensis TaxID=246437 RepID=L9L029_TUPCH|nr:Potassium voltage-gated channel subfamily S member 1 [Tupaia chinensis]
MSEAHGAPRSDLQVEMFVELIHFTEQKSEIQRKGFAQDHASNGQCSWIKNFTIRCQSQVEEVGVELHYTLCTDCGKGTTLRILAPLILIASRAKSGAAQSTDGKTEAQSREQGPEPGSPGGAAREFYFDRHPGFFLGLLHFYRPGHLHVLDELCVFAFGQEADYWGLSEGALATCCRARYLERRVARPRAWDEDSDTPSSVDPAEEVRDDPVLRRLEYFCIAWFSFEVSSRLLLAPSTRNFFCHPLNLIDIVSVLPFYLTLLAGVALGDQGGAGGEELGDLGKVVQVFRLMRIFRVLKLARHSTGLRSLGATLKHSYREVGILLLYLAVGVSVFSGVAYTAEKEEDVGFDTIPACWWWGTVSMTTVGYGDVVPVTVAGKLAASGCILGGILVVALPITIIFNKFSHFYRRQKALEAAVRDSGHREFEDLLSSMDGVSEASMETSRETSQEGQSADLETQAPSEPPDSRVY